MWPITMAAINTVNVAEVENSLNELTSETDSSSVNTPEMHNDSGSILEIIDMVWKSGKGQ